MEKTKEQVNVEVPENFRSTIMDFSKDLTITYPEFSVKWEKWLQETTTEDDYKELYVYCLGIYPQRFFDILNQNNDIFQKENDINTYFLPNVNFKELYHCEGVTDNTRETLWKYLQLILFVLVGTMKDKMDFGDAMNMFNQFGETELENKLQDAMTNIHDFFSNMETKNTNGTNETNERTSNENTTQDSNRTIPNLPQPEQIHDHLMGLFDGKIGKLAKDLAEDLTGDIQGTLGIDLENVSSSKDVLKQLMKNPNKISGLVKTVGEKLNERMSSGEITQQDLLSEAGTMMKKMKDMGGGDMGAMFKNMAQTMGMNMSQGARFNQNAFSQMEKSINTREQFKERAAESHIKREANEIIKSQELKKREEDHAKFMAENPNIFNTDDPNSLVYRVEGEKQEKSGLKPSPSSKNKNKKKKKVKK